MLAAFAALIWNTPSGGAVGSTLEVGLSSGNLGANSDVSLVVSIPGSSPFPDRLEIRFPSGWKFDDWGSSGSPPPNPGQGEVIAVGQVVDPTFGTLPISIRSFGTNLGIASWLIETPRLCCISTTLSGSVLNGYTFVLDTALAFSTPAVLELTFFGALGDGTTLLTNPVTPGLYHFLSTEFDFLGQPSVASDVVEVGPEPVGGAVELSVGSDDSPFETQNGHERDLAALAVALAVVAGVAWHRYRRRAA